MSLTRLDHFFFYLFPLCCALEMRKLMLDRIDADGDHRLSLDEFVVLFEEEQRKAIVMRYARCVLFSCPCDDPTAMSRQWHEVA